MIRLPHLRSLQTILRDDGYAGCAAMFVMQREKARELNQETYVRIVT
jgi:hypothetical protein